MGANLGSDNQQGSLFSKEVSFTDINVTPFVDIVLVLLMIFMVTAPFAISGVNVQLPVTKTKPITMNGDPLVLSISVKGEFYLGKNLIKQSDLVNKLKSLKGNDKDISIYIRADKGVPYGKVMEAMASAQFVGINKVGMLGEALKGK